MQEVCGTSKFSVISGGDGGAIGGGYGMSCRGVVAEHRKVPSVGVRAGTHGRRLELRTK